MKKFFVILLVLLSGCAREYEANMRARENIVLYQTQARSQAVTAVMDAVKMVIRPIEIQWAYQNTDRPTCKTEETAMLSAMREMIRWHGMAELERARAQAVQYLSSTLQAIYRQHVQNFGTPMSTNELLSRIAGNIPVLATVAGMYGLGTAAVRYAGDQINATIESGAALNVKGEQVLGGKVTGDGNSYTSTATTNRYLVQGDPAPGGVNEIEFSGTVEETEE